jgi:hypothetical protein
LEEVVYSWCSFFSTKGEFASLMDLVEEGSLEELFLAEVKENEIAGKSVGKAKAIAFAFSKDALVLQKLEKVCQSFSLDEVDDCYFEKNGDEFILKGVRYPESEVQEEILINKLL